MSKKKLNYTWHRLRKWLKPKQDPLAYAQLSVEHDSLLSLEEQGYVQVYFGDESGFCLDPCVPYGWQPRGRHTAIVPKNGKRRNILGFLSRNNDFVWYDTDPSSNAGVNAGSNAGGSFTAKRVVECIDDFATRIKQKTILILDNARIHTAAVVKAKMAQWQAQDLYIWFLPAYSPHLNLIEILWKKIKYEWLRPVDYENQAVFTDALDNILNNISKTFTIKFT